MTRTSIEPSTQVSELLARLQEIAPAFYKEVCDSYTFAPDLFLELAEPIITSASVALGDGWKDALIRGYVNFVIDVNKSQLIYEKSGGYPNSSYDKVFEAVYGSDEFMARYHWGVLMTTFFWRHHLALYRWFKEHFVSLLPEEGGLVDLGAGSGVWHLMTLLHRPQWSVNAVDISSYSVRNANIMARAAGLNDGVSYVVHDALTYRLPEPAAAGISCFVLEHLESPQRLFESLAANLKPHAPAFVTAALTAAEIDHIAEFRRESEVILMAENAGFRVISTFSSGPTKHATKYRFLPRSMGLVLQLRNGEIW